jgi:hypothetical protein
MGAELHLLLSQSTELKGLNTQLKDAERHLQTSADTHAVSLETLSGDCPPCLLFADPITKGALA